MRRALLPPARETAVLAGGAAVLVLGFRVVALRSQRLASLLVTVPVAAVFLVWCSWGGGPADAILARVSGALRLLLLYNFATVLFVILWLAGLPPLCASLGLRGGATVSALGAGLVWACCATAVTTGAVQW